MNKRILIIGLAFLCIECFLLDTIMDMQAKEDKQRNQWNAALIGEIQKLKTEK